MLARAGDRLAAGTGASREEWARIAEAFPDLPPRLASRALRARRRLRRISSRALSTGRWPVDLDGPEPPREPCVFVTAHVGGLQALRYALRARGIPAASLLGPLNLDRRVPARLDGVFDARHPLDFPHALPADAVHRLRSALRRGSLIAAADLPAAGAAAVEAPFLGGRVLLDPRPLRLAGAARVACLPAFLTLPGRRLVLTVGEPLPTDPRRACLEFAAILERVVRDSPGDLDGSVYRAAAARLIPA